jgi:hypothetical protein
LARTESFCKMWGIPTDFELEKIPESEQQSFLLEEDLDSEFELVDILQSNAMYKKMQDVELVLRFFAYRQLSGIEQGRLQDFLDIYLKLGNLFPADILEQLGELFTETSDFIYKVLGERAFFLLRKRKNNTWQWFERPTKVLYDPLMYAFSNHLKHKETLVSKSTEIENKLEEFYKLQATTFEGRSTNQQDIFKRMDLLDTFLNSFLE